MSKFLRKKEDLDINSNFLKNFSGLNSIYNRNKKNIKS